MPGEGGLVAPRTGRPGGGAGRRKRANIPRNWFSSEGLVRRRLEEVLGVLRVRPRFALDVRLPVLALLRAELVEDALPREVRWYRRGVLFGLLRVGGLPAMTRIIAQMVSVKTWLTRGMNSKTSETRFQGNTHLTRC